MLIVRPWSRSRVLRKGGGGRLGGGRRGGGVGGQGGGGAAAAARLYHRYTQQIEEEQQQHFRLLVKTSRYFPSSAAPPVLAVTSPSFCRLVNPLCLWGIAHSSLQKRHQVLSARVRRHTVFDDLAPLAEHSADILVPPHNQTPAQCGFFRSRLLVICTAKPRYTAAAAR